VTEGEVRDKVFDLLNDAPRSVFEVVYVLVKVRKLLEFHNAKHKFPFLALLCDWVLHTELDKSGAKRLIETLDAELTSKVWDPKLDDAENRFWQIITLDLLNRDFQRFLAQEGLPLVWVDDIYAWRQFLIFYGEEIKGTPLILRGKSRNTRFFKQVVIESCEASEAIAEANPHMKHTGLHWAFTMNSGERYRIIHTFSWGEEPEGWKPQGRRE
jgi:hypothetical protein